MVISFLIIVVLLLILVIGKINLSYKFDREVKKLFSQSTIPSDKIFHKSQLDHLPEPVQRYFNLVLKDGQPYISYVRITHSGQFKTGLNNGWINILGEQYATTEKPGFIWKGTTTMFTARDMYIGDRGRLVVSILSLYNVVNAEGEQYNQGELLRWLGESILYPTNFLPGKKLQWFAIDSLTAKLIFNYNNLSLLFIVSFNNIGEIIQLEAKRFMDEKGLETWIIKMADYREMNNVFVPTRFEVLWRLAKADFSYAKFNITAIEYDKPEKF